MLQQKPWHLPTAEAKANFECCELRSVSINCSSVRLDISSTIPDVLFKGALQMSQW